MSSSPRSLTLVRPPLMAHQARAVSACIDALVFDGIRRPAVALPTGSGKTRATAELVYRLLEEPQPRSGRTLLDTRPGLGRVLYLAHREELLTQAREAYLQYFPPEQLGIVQGASFDQPGRRVVFAMVQTLAQASRLARVLAYGRFDVVVIDECHHAPSDNLYRSLVGTKKEPKYHVLTETGYLLGMTATPQRADGRSLGIIFDKLVHAEGILDLIACEPPVLCDLRPIAVPVPDLDLSRVRRTESGEFDLRDLERQTVAQKDVRRSRHQAALDTLWHYPELHGKCGVAFWINVTDAFAFADLATAAGIPTVAASGETPAFDFRDPDNGEMRPGRKRINKGLSSGEWRFLSNCGLFTEGWDEELVEIVVIGRHTASPSLYIQMIGRGTRPLREDRGKPYAEWRKRCCYVIDLYDHAHTVLVTPAFLGLEDDALRGRSVREVLREQLEDGEEQPKAVMKPPEPVYQRSNRPPEVAAGSLYTSMPWKLVGGTYHLPNEHGLYTASPGFGIDAMTQQRLYSCEFRARKEDGSYEAPKQVVGETVLEKACGFGEQDLLRRRATQARREDPRTKSSPVTDGQWDALRKIWPTLYRSERRPTQGEYQLKMDQLKAAGGKPGAWWAQFGPRSQKAKKTS